MDGVVFQSYEAGRFLRPQLDLARNSNCFKRLLPNLILPFIPKKESCKDISILLYLAIIDVYLFPIQPSRSYRLMTQ